MKIKKTIELGNHNTKESISYQQRESREGDEVVAKERQAERRERKFWEFY